MKLLLDTHAFLWWDTEPARLSPQVFRLCHNPAHDLVVSVASIWEIQIKCQLGKLALSSPLAEILRSQQQANGLQILPIIPEHILTIDQLPLHHKDPFDRVLIAQALYEGAVIATIDPLFQQYQASLIW